MEEKNQPVQSQMAEEPVTPFMRTFSSKEEADLYNLKKDLQLTDMEKFQLFCRMIKIGRMLATAKTDK